MPHGGSETNGDYVSNNFCIGHHDSCRDGPASQGLLGAAQHAGYDFLTTPLTTSHFRSRTLEILQEHVDRLQKANNSGDVPLPVLPLLTSEDTTLSPDNSNSCLVGLISQWIDLASPDPLIAHVSRNVLNAEVAYAAFCGINNIIVPGPVAGADTTQFARDIVGALAIGLSVQLHVLLPMDGESDLDIGDVMHLSELRRDHTLGLEDAAPDEADGNESLDSFDTWEVWHKIRSLADFDSRCTVVLEMPRHLPSPAVQSRWFAEPIRLLTYPHTSFVRNSKDYPVLSQPHQQLLTRFMHQKFPPWILLCDVGVIQTNIWQDPTPAEAEEQSESDELSHLHYMRYLQDHQPLPSAVDRWAHGFQDWLQSPLQPLTDNLESITYEVFEQDPVKYDWYERAIASALTDLSAKLGSSRSEFIIAVAGAGRGPLVTRAIRASRSTGIRAQFWAVEKNPNAYVHLQQKNLGDSLWDGQVHIVKSDMRHWKGPTSGAQSDEIAEDRTKKVDILISELLGSFADNELSPECLDGVQHVLDPSHGINIPQSYSAHLTPIYTPRIYADLRSRPDNGQWETPWVVMLHQFDFLSTKSSIHQTVDDSNDDRQLHGSQPKSAEPVVKRAWSFCHPLSQPILDQAHHRASGAIDAGGAMGGNGSNEHNARSCRLRFDCSNRGVCHGLAGYFECVLYASASSDKEQTGEDIVQQKIELSTNPVTMAEKSEDMISWFPIFFPLKTPVFIPENSTVEISMWRQTNDLKVWYEYAIEVFAPVGKSGKQVKVGGSELVSTFNRGYLMS